MFFYTDWWLATFLRCDFDYSCVNFLNLVTHLRNIRLGISWLSLTCDFVGGLLFCLVMVFFVFDNCPVNFYRLLKQKSDLLCSIWAAGSDEISQILLFNSSTPINKRFIDFCVCPKFFFYMGLMNISHVISFVFN